VVSPNGTSEDLSWIKLCHRQIGTPSGQKVLTEFRYLLLCDLHTPKWSIMSKT
jgi:hypothetical protein